MKTKFGFILILLFSLLVSCTPAPAPTPTATVVPTLVPTATITPIPTPTVQPTSIPWTLENAIEKLPEVYTNSVENETINTYKSLLANLPVSSQKWITGMGWGLEDHTIDEYEIELLTLLQGKNSPSNLSILTNPLILDGVTKKDLIWAQNISIDNVNSLLQNNINVLLERNLLSSENDFLANFLSLAKTNYEIEKRIILN